MAADASVRIPGIHHISAICGDPQTNIDFYSDVLGLRLVKKTVNYDDPGACAVAAGSRAGRACDPRLRRRDSLCRRV
jgi:glyoxalase family protein